MSGTELEFSTLDFAMYPVRWQGDRTSGKLKASICECDPEFATYALGRYAICHYCLGLGGPWRVLASERSPGLSP